MRRIKLFGDWDKQGEALVHQAFLQTLGTDDQYCIGENQFVWDDNYTHAVIFNFPRQRLLTPAENNIGLILEPPEILDVMYRGKAERKRYPQVGKYFSFARQDGFEWAPFIGFGTVSATQDNLRPIETKSKRMCMMISNKRITPYHAVRHEIFKSLLQTNLDIHFYGRGLSGEDPRIKGEIPPMQKQAILGDYQYVIDFENNAYGGVTDKFFDTIMCGSVPVSNLPEINEHFHALATVLTSFEEPIASIVDKIKDTFYNGEPREYSFMLSYMYNHIVRGSINLPRWIVRQFDE